MPHSVLSSSAALNKPKTPQSSDKTPQLSRQQSTNKENQSVVLATHEITVNVKSAAPANATSNGWFFVSLNFSM
jgi:hypothetical protein